MRIPFSFFKSRAWRFGWVAAVLLGGMLPVPGEDLKILPGHVPAGMAGLESLGRMPATSRLRMAIGLPLRDRAGLVRFVEQDSDPASPNFRRHATIEELTERFGPAVQDYEAVKTFARANGLTIEETHSNRLLLDVSGPAAAVEKAFHLTLLTYRHPTENRNFFAPDREPRVAAGLPVVDIQGLSDYSRPRPLSSRTRVSPVATAQSSGTAPDGSGYFFGDDFRAAYAPGVTNTGAGQTVGLLEFDNYYPADITKYATVAGGGRTNIVINPVLLDGYNGAPAGGNLEVSVDIEMVMALAPGLAGIVCFEGNPDYAIPNDVLNRMLSSNNIATFSSSWSWSGGPSATTDAIFMLMDAAGQTFFQASGDHLAYPPGAAAGSGGVDDPDEETTPCSSPYITVVGGTTLSMAGTGASWGSEIVWNWGTEGIEAGIGGSGGVSGHYSLPVWQANVGNLAGLGGSTTNRNIPDVAANADHVFGYYQNGLDNDQGGYLYNFGGTSFAAPTWAGFMALVNQQSALQGGESAGFINPAIYALAAGTNYTNCFHDVISGNNTNASSPNLFYAANNYDLCTGLGSMGGSNLISELAGFAAAFANLTANPSIIYGATAVTLAGRVGARVPALGYVYPTNGATVTVAIGGQSQTTTIDDSTGDFSIIYNPGALAASATPYTIIYSYAGGSLVGGATNSTTALTVEQKTVTVLSGITANNKAYDGTTTATISSNNVVLTGVLAGDTASVALSTNGYGANFLTASAGTGKTVIVSGLTLTGGAAGNYTLTQPAGLTANITAVTGLYVANAGTGTISLVPANGTVSTLATGFNGPEGLAFDRAGNLYVANYGNNTVSKMTPAGAVTTYAVGFNGPQGMTFDGSGNLYVANYKGNTVSKVTTNGVVSTLAGGFNGPGGLVFDRAGNLYVASLYSGLVSKVTPGGAVTTWFGPLATPGGLAFDTAGNLYISSVANNEVWKVTTNGVAAVFASGISAPGQLAFDGSGNLYATSISGGTVSQVTPGGTVTTYASGFSTPVGLAIQNPVVRLQILLPGESAAPNTLTGKTGSPTAELAGVPFTVTVNAVDGNWVVAPEASPTVAISSSDPGATLPVSGALVNGTQTLAATLVTAGSQTLTATDLAASDPLAANTSTAVVVGSGAATRLLVVLPGTATSGVAFTGTVTALDAFGNTAKGYTGTVHFSGTDGAAVLPGNLTLSGGAATFGLTLVTPGHQTVTATDTVSLSVNGTSGVVSVGGAAEPVGLYVANAGSGTISLVTTNGTISTLASGFNGPEGLAFDRTGNLYVANYGGNSVSKVIPAGAVTTYAVGFNGPQGMAFDGSGNLYVANYKGNTVSKVTTGGVVSTLAGGFNGPGGLVFDRAGNLYVASLYSGLVSKVTPGGAVTTWFGPLATPGGLAFDPAGNLYISSVANNEVWKVTTNGVATVFASGISAPGQLVFDGFGNLYVTSISGGTVSKVTPGGTVTTYAGGFSTPVGLGIQNPAARLQILLPGESGAPDTVMGKTGSPGNEVAGTSFSVTVNAVDGNGVVVPSASPVVALTSSDGAAGLPANAALASGTQTFTVTLDTIGSQTVTATDTTAGHPLAASTSSSVTVISAETPAYRGAVRGGGGPVSGAIAGASSASPDGTPATGFALTVSVPGGLAPQEGATVMLSISGAVGVKLQVLVSSDLSNPGGWATLTNITLTTSPVSFPDPGDGLLSSRYYRVVQLP